MSRGSGATRNAKSHGYHDEGQSGTHHSSYTHRLKLLSRVRRAPSRTPPLGWGALLQMRGPGTRSSPRCLSCEPVRDRQAGVQPGLSAPARAHGEPGKPSYLRGPRPGQVISNTRPTSEDDPRRGGGDPQVDQRSLSSFPAAVALAISSGDAVEAGPRPPCPPPTTACPHVAGVHRRGLCCLSLADQGVGLRVGDAPAVTGSRASSGFVVALAICSGVIPSRSKICSLIT